MIKIVHEGDKWAALTCTYAGLIKSKVNEGGGVFRDTNTFSYVLKCECGQELTIARNVFRGKRVVVDCGCGVSADNSKSMMSLSLTKSMQDAIVLVAEKEQVNRSYAANKLVRWGFKRWQEENGVEEEKKKVAAVQKANGKVEEEFDPFKW